MAPAFINGTTTASHAVVGRISCARSFGSGLPRTSPAPLRRGPRASALPGDSNSNRDFPCHRQRQGPAASSSAAAGEALIRTLAGVHAASGRGAAAPPPRVNVVLGADNSEAAWRRIDQRVNSYPSLREFTAIGSGGSSFSAAMVAAVSAVVGDVACVSHRRSAGGRYISVTVGPVLVRNADDVLEVYTRMKTDARLRYFL